MDPQQTQRRLRGTAGHREIAPGSGRGSCCVEIGFRVRFFRADLLVEALYRGLADNSVGRVIDSILRRSELVVVDELGFSPLDGIAANHLFRFIATAYETRSLAITSNWPFEQWTNFLPDATSATAILDGFLHHADVVVLSGESYACVRLAITRNVPFALSTAPRLESEALRRPETPRTHSSRPGIPRQLSTREEPDKIVTTGHGWGILVATVGEL